MPEDLDLLAEICDDPDDEETDYGRGYRTGYDVGYAEGRRDGAVTPTSPWQRIAADLGIDPDQLRAAARRHAKGGLRP